jgi:hypothetical protein
VSPCDGEIVITLVQVSNEFTPGLQLFPPNDPREIMNVRFAVEQGTEMVESNPPPAACTQFPEVKPLSVTLVPVKLVVA